MATVSPRQINQGESIVPALWNDPINTVADELNGGIDNANIASDAAIDGSKLATNTQIAMKPLLAYKFSVYRAAALNSANTFTAVAMDTKLYDTSTNIDVVTNKGRFTAPVAGTYHFSGSAGNSAASGTAIHAKLYKNGSAVKAGSYNGAGTSTGWISHVSGDVLLAVNDYVELYFIGGSGSAMFVGQDLCFFDGYLVSV